MNDTRQQKTAWRLFHQRLGRLKFVLYQMVVLIVVPIAATPLLTLTGDMSLAPIFIAIILVAMLPGTVRRVHDLNWPGLAALVFLVPPLNFILWGLSGSPEANRYGGPPAENSIWIEALTAIIPIVLITFAISIPEHGGYTNRAKVQEATSLSWPARTALGIACREDLFYARVTQTGTTLNLPAAASITGKYVESVKVHILNQRQATVTVAMQNLDDGVEGTVVYSGECTTTGLTWTVGGTLDEKYLPKN
ncbi:MAG: DUF805 domain-containing protein [Chromatiales bacterium]|jgi:type IV pilus assembly protein PilA|nr:DUF805 domain-containing protein [Chromatiales bacterium]